MKRIVGPTDIIALILAVILIWAAQDGAKMEIVSTIMLIFAGMLLGVAVNKIAVRLHRAHKSSKGKNRVL